MQKENRKNVNNSVVTLNERPAGFQGLPRLSWLLSLRNNVRGRSQIKFGMTPNCMGFTLIELLVVVLIIGILAAVALPQYQKAVEKSRAATIFPLLKAIGDAQENYYLANGTYATSFDDLSVDIPLTGTEKFSPALADARSSNDWSIQLFPTINAVVAGRLTGSYAGAVFVYFYGDWGCDGGMWCARARTLACTYNISWGGITYSRGDAGKSYCEKIFKATTTVQIGGNMRYYALP